MNEEPASINDFVLASYDNDMVLMRFHMVVILRVAVYRSSFPCPKCSSHIPAWTVAVALLGLFNQERTACIVLGISIVL